MDKKSFGIRRGIYLLLIVISLVFLSFYGGPLPYMVFFALIINMIASMIYIMYIFNSIRISQNILEHSVDKNQYVKLKFQIGNEGMLAGTSIKLNFNHEFSEVSGCEELEHIGLEPKQYIVKELELLCRYSGTYYAGVDSIEITDYFGIFHIRFEMPQRMKVVVRPRILKIDNLKFLNDNEQQVNSSNYRQDEAVVDNETRLCQSGDNAGMIHWRNSMKMQKLLVRTMSAEEAYDYIVTIDETIRLKDNVERIISADKVRETAIAVINYMYSCGYNIGCAMTQTGIIRLNDQYGLTQLYNRISGCNFVGDNNVSNVIENAIYDTAYSGGVYAGEGQQTYIIVSVNPADECMKGIKDQSEDNIVWINVNDYQSVDEMFLAE